MTSAEAGDQVRVSVLVALEREEAFRVFTEEMQQWWLRGPAYRMGGGGPSEIELECALGGRLLESYQKAGQQTRVFEVGRVSLWQPPERFVFTWRAVNFAPSESTEVEVQFTPRAGGTEVVDIHRGRSRIRPDHPVRHGKDVSDFARLMGMHWARLLTALREWTVTA